jgi:hypothetical protein
MTDTGNWDRPEKQKARELALEDVGQKTSTLWLPGEDTRCVDLARDRGVVTQETFIVAVEEDRATAGRIRRRLAKRGWTRQSVVMNQTLTAVRLRSPLDFAFLDLCGQPDEPLARWIEQHLADNLFEGADLSITFRLFRRNNLFMEQVEKALKTPKGGAALLHLAETLGIYNPAILLPLVVVLCCLRHQSFRILTPAIYRDEGHVSMLLLRLRDIRRSTETWWPSISDIISGVERGWREGAYSEGARKAWETLHEQGPRIDPETARRSDIARKAWATRRANGWIHPAKLRQGSGSDG